MHVPPRFSISEEEALAFAERRGFGLLTGHDGEAPIGSHLPFVLLRDGALRVQFHVALANPLQHLADGRNAMLAVAGADAYVSNDWYATPDQVSTWLYEAVHLTGPLTRVDAAAHRTHGAALLETFEGRLAPKPPWTLDAMAPGKRQAMLDAIVTLEMAVTRVEGQCKLNQHKPDVDHLAIARALARVGGDAAVLAAKMRALRPGLDYGADPT